MLHNACSLPLHSLESVALPANASQMFCPRHGTVPTQAKLTDTQFTWHQCPVVDDGQLSLPVTSSSIVPGTLGDMRRRLYALATLCGKSFYDFELNCGATVSSRAFCDLGHWFPSVWWMPRNDPYRRVIEISAGCADAIHHWIYPFNPMCFVASSVVAANHPRLVALTVEVTAAETIAATLSWPMTQPPSLHPKRDAAQAAYDKAMAADNEHGTDATLDALGVAHRALQDAWLRRE